MKWKPIKTAPARQEILVLTDLGEVLVAFKKRKNGKYFDIKNTINGKIEWATKDKHERNLTYWLEIPNLTKKQFAATFEMHKDWNKMFKY